MKTSMKKTIRVVLLALAFPSALWANEELHLDSADIDINNKASLQRGAQTFVNNCLSCHSAKHLRYSRMAADLEIPADQVKANLMFASDKIGSGMEVAITAEKAAKWFGTLPPDLSVMARAKGDGNKGADWLYTYLRSFYRDDKRPFGVNNLVFKDVGMPNIFWKLQGAQEPVVEMVKHGEHEESVITGLKLVTPGTQTPEEFDKTVRDLVAFLVYMGEPAQFQRADMGPWVLAYLFFFLAIAIVLKKEYWRDIPH